jgi:hypothetical protein
LGPRFVIERAVTIRFGSELVDTALGMYELMRKRQAKASSKGRW